MLFSPQILARRYKQAVAAAAPTVLQLTSPNDFQNAVWQHFACATSANNHLAPDSTNTASQLLSSQSGGFVAARQTIPITMASGTNYSLTGYIKSTTAPVWAEIVIDDAGTGTNFIQYWVDTTAGAGAAGATQTTGLGVIDGGGPTVSAAGNSYTKFVFNFHFTSTPTSGNLVDIRFVDANNGTTPTNLQNYDVWGWGA